MQDMRILHVALQLMTCWMLCYDCLTTTLPRAPLSRLTVLTPSPPCPCWHCSKIAEAEAAVSVNEKMWLVMHMHVGIVHHTAAVLAALHC
jgi:hypothetical protein